MEPERTPAQEIGEGYTHVALGCTFAAGIILFMGAGWFLDRWLHLTPVLTVVGALVGAVLSFTWVYLKLEAERQRREARRK
jgi:F0F1-type ATP synthase assembly protein I